MDMLQYGEDIILIDCGIQFPEDNMYGADFSIPDISFLTKYTDKIAGLLITHGHLDHIGSLKAVLPALNFPPLYGTKLTIGLIKKQLEEHKLLDKTTLIEVDAGSDKQWNVGPFKVEYFKVNHSIPDCAGLYITSPGGATFMHTGDFKVDMEPVIDEPANLSRIGAFGKK
jgi:ribonuclease J